MRRHVVGVMLAMMLAVGTAAGAEAPPDVGAAAMFRVDNLWVMIGAMLVFIMHLGFACVESGLTRAKNCTNILFKNTVTPAIGILTYALCGFALMYPGETNWMLGQALGFAGFGLHDPAAADPMAYNGKFTYWTDFLFQGMFAATAATIVSGAVAERIKLNSYMVFTAVYVAIVYPILGSWGWGGGWLLDRFNFHDFAGSTFVHSIGGWAALSGILLLGPRIGKYVNGKPMAIMGHSMPLATIGVFLLWFGWFGFNGASALSADPQVVSLVLVNTTLAAAAGILAAMVSGMALLKRIDFSMALNGCLAGLVAITAGCDAVTPLSAIVIGLIAGVLVVLAVLGFDRLMIDDPVGALSVHLVNGVWGTLAVGLFSSQYSVLSQLVGILSVGGAAFATSFAIFYVLKKTLGIRITETEELRGLDVWEHGSEAYAGFQIFTNV